MTDSFIVKYIILEFIFSNSILNKFFSINIEEINELFFQLYFPYLISRFNFNLINSHEFTTNDEFFTSNKNSDHRIESTQCRIHPEIYSNSDIGFYYYNARWYSAELGRFITEDPIKDGVNWYVYVGNNPMIYTDPTGLELKVEGSEEFVNEVEVTLQELDPSAYIDRETGQVMQDSEVDIKGHEYGNELIRRLVENEDHTATIYDPRDENKKAEIAKKLKLDVEDLSGDMAAINDGMEHGNPRDAINGVGVGGYVAFNPEYKPSEKTFYGQSIPEPGFILLGHELIHAEHYFSGTYTQMIYRLPISAEGYEFSYEENRTVGTVGIKPSLIPGERPAYSYTRNKTKYFSFSTDLMKTDITENMLRIENNLPIRPRYKPDEIENSTSVWG